MLKPGFRLIVAFLFLLCHLPWNKHCYIINLNAQTCSEIFTILDFLPDLHFNHLLWKSIDFCCILSSFNDFSHWTLWLHLLDLVASFGICLGRAHQSFNSFTLRNGHFIKFHCIHCYFYLWENSKIYIQFLSLLMKRKMSNVWIWSYCSESFLYIFTSILTLLTLYQTRTRFYYIFFSIKIKKTNVETFMYHYIASNIFLSFWTEETIFHIKIDKIYI